MQVGLVVLGRRAAFDEVQVCAFLNDDEGVLELSGSLGVEAEVALQWVLYRDTGRYVDERAA